MFVEVIIERFSTNKLCENKVKEAVKAITEAAQGRAVCSGVVGRYSKLLGPQEESLPNGTKRYRYEFTVKLEKVKFRTEDTAKKALEQAKKFVQRAAEGRSWLYKGEVLDVKEAAAIAEAKPAFVLPQLTPQVMEYYFGHIKERDAHIRLMYDSIATYIETGREERNHTLLYGEPAAAKTILIEAFKAWFEDGDGQERIAMVNATTLSKAGLENWILDKAKINMLPEIIWINELEKGEADDFLCLLNIMDGQGKISRLNSKIGKQEANAKVLIWADCNNERKLRSWNSGSLWSRFNKRWGCVRPSREVAKEILSDVIRNRIDKGYYANPVWAELCVNYAFDVMKTNDLRVMKGLLDGKNRLEDGTYFKDIEYVRDAERVAGENKESLT
jgi:hypothetical protein